MRKVDDVASAN